MRKIAFGVCIVVLSSLQGLLAQSIVFVSPSTKGLLNMACAEDTLSSFEQEHYLAAARYLTNTLCPQSHVESAVGVWKGQAENSGMIDGCSNEPARELGALLARYYHQERALVFDRNERGKASLLSFRASQPLGVIAIMMAQANVTGATVIPHKNDNYIWIVAADPGQRAQALNLYSSLHGDNFREATGTSELIGDSDRVKAREIYSAILARAPAEVRELDTEMYSEQFNDLGLNNTTPAH